MTNQIEIKGLSKTFNKGKVKALKNVDLSIKKGEIFALLGPNGAGKTTTMRILATLSKPDAGEVLIEGKNVFDDCSRIRRRIGFLTNEIRYDGRLTPNELADFYGRLYEMTDDELANNKAKLFDSFGITEFADRRYGKLSTGMKQKTSIAMSLINDPDIIIFDEPTNGLDVLTIQTVEQFIIDSSRKNGKTVVLSTHILDVAERLCDRTGIIIDGISVFCGSMQDFLNAEGKDNLREAFLEAYKRNHTEK